MKPASENRAALSTLIVLAIVAIGSLGVTDCDEAFRKLEVAGRHEQRLSALEDCECEGILAPVCAENGNTYINRCEARCAQTRIVSIGRCAPPECGGRAGAACGEGEFCETHAGCDATAPGVCAEIPEACLTLEAVPVCGCDGKTYMNDCHRRAAGVALDFRGACEAPPIACEDNTTCESDEYCRKRDGVCDTHLGLCTPRPLFCTQDAPGACGCDGKTYYNACAAASEGVSVDYLGPCEPGPVACGDNADCQTNEYCLTHAGQCQAEGVCTLRPELCTYDAPGACGCDGKTYSNECAAANAGVSLASRGVCTPPGVAICHVPPGNPDNRHTIFVDASAVPAHLRHGDYRGECDGPAR